jgi:hypothetical protein
VSRLAAAVGAVLLFGAGSAAAQTPTRPGPWVFDVRGVTSPVPEESAFYPRLHPTALVPGRGFGIGAGAHIYLMNVGASRLGVGAHLMRVRAVTRPPVPTTTSGTPAVQPQQLQVDLQTVGSEVSFNFGSRDGWSYLSAGAGLTDVTAVTAVVDPGRRESGSLATVNFGGGARWFMRSRMAFGFDLRFYRVGAGDGGTVQQQPPTSGTPVVPQPPVPTPAKMIVMVGAGVSFR